MRNNEGHIVKITNSHRIIQSLVKANIMAIYVDFGELARFRSPGNYGFRDQDIDKRLFEMLEKAGIIVPVKSKQIVGDSSNVQLYLINSNEV